MDRLSELRTLQFWRRFAQLQVGLLMFGLGISLMLRASIGLDPWSTFHEGVSINLPVSFGRITQLTGLIIVAVSYLWLGERPGVGTVCNMAFVGPWVDLLRPHMDLLSGQDWGLTGGVLQFAVGLVIVGIASGLYIAARLGAGPRDTLILGSSERLGISVRMTRVGLELMVLTIGWFLGGPVGLGTILFALLMGPMMQASLRVFRYDHAHERGLADEPPGESELPK
jgi:uncharacterized membrane protein YczE